MRLHRMLRANANAVTGIDYFADHLADNQCFVFADRAGPAPS
jgi:hypothetical protein